MIRQLGAGQGARREDKGVSAWRPGAQSSAQPESYPGDPYATPPSQAGTVTLDSYPGDPYAAPAPQAGPSGGVTIGGTTGGPLVNPAYQYGSGARDQATSDPLFFTPSSQVPGGVASGWAPLTTSGESRPQTSMPNAYRYPGSEGWVSAGGQPVQRG